MQHILLTGAGFSRNWGGWLANEAFEYLLGAPQIDNYLRDILWRSKLRGDGFEGALSVVQGHYAALRTTENKAHLDALTDAVIAMFTDMQKAFDKITINREDLRLHRFLHRFDAIFTLNQDTFLETHYAGPVRWSERWYGSYFPYMRFVDEPKEAYGFMLRAPQTPDIGLTSDGNYQPIYKLHGSYNWFAEPNGGRLLVMGGNKPATIKEFPVLARYQADFQSVLSQPDTKLMVIGYSFGDPHINSVIIENAKRGLNLFVIDPSGVDVIDKRNPRAQIPEPVPELMDALMPNLIGASRRNLNEIIFTDLVEHEKVMRFFDGQAEVLRISTQN